MDTRLVDAGGLNIIVHHFYSLKDWQREMKNTELKRGLGSSYTSNITTGSQASCIYSGKINPAIPPTPSSLSICSSPLHSINSVCSLPAPLPTLIISSEQRRKQMKGG